MAKYSTEQLNDDIAVIIDTIKRSEEIEKEKSQEKAWIETFVKGVISSVSAYIDTPLKHPQFRNYLAPEVNAFVANLETALDTARHQENLDYTSAEVISKGAKEYQRLITAFRNSGGTYWNAVVIATQDIKYITEALSSLKTSFDILFKGRNEIHIATTIESIYDLRSKIQLQENDIQITYVFPRFNDTDEPELDDSFITKWYENPSSQHALCKTPVEAKSLLYIDYNDVAMFSIDDVYKALVSTEKGKPFSNYLYYCKGTNREVVLTPFVEARNRIRSMADSVKTLSRHVV